MWCDTQILFSYESVTTKLSEWEGWIKKLVLLLFGKVYKSSEFCPVVACKPDCKPQLLVTTYLWQGSVITIGSLTFIFLNNRLWSHKSKNPSIAIKKCVPNMVRKARISPKAK